MAVVLMQSMPPEVPVAALDAVTERMNVKADPPPGLIVHTHYERDGHAHVLDVWQSRVQYEMFRNERLLPAMMEVAAQHGLDLGDGPPEPTIIDAHDFVLGG